MSRARSVPFLALVVLVAFVFLYLVVSTPISAIAQKPAGPASDMASAAARGSLYLPLVMQSGVPGTSPVTTQTPVPPPAPTQTPTPAPTQVPAVGDAVLVGAGDMRNCNQGIKQVADLVKTIPGTVMMLGDATVTGAPSEYPCYDASWGQVKNRTIPVVGNHEYLTAGAPGYFGYFGAAAHGPEAYYSLDLGAWHVIILNSNCSKVGGCQVGSTQEKWLKADLAQHPNQCTLAMMHHPLFNSGNQGNTVAVQPLFQDLYNSGVHLVLVGHEHNYERFARQDPSGKADPNGIREFIVGSGGAGGGSWVTTQPNSQVHAVSVLGVLKLTLHAASYDWQFVPIPGTSFTDSGTESCR